MALKKVETNTTARADRHVPRSDHTRIVRYQQQMGKGVLWAAAGITMAALVLIVGYILINGFYTRSVKDYPVSPFTQKTVLLDGENGAEGGLIANGSLRLGDLSYDKLRELYRGDTTFWGYITGQNRNTKLYVFGDPTFLRQAARYVLGEGERFGGNVTVVPSKEGLLEAVRNDKGALAFVPASWIDGERGVRTVGIRQASAVVHPEILSLQAGRRLNRLTMTQVRQLFTGEAEFWADVGGPSYEIEPADLSAGDKGIYEPMQVVPVVFEETVPLMPELFRETVSRGRGEEELILRGNTIYVDSVQSFAETIGETKGAVGIIRRKEALSFGLSPILIERTTHSLNLRPSFLIRPPSRAGAVGGVSYIIVNTIAMVLFVLLIATPIGVAAAIYLVEYAKQGKLFNILRTGVDTLAAVPSIIFGLFGLVVFAQLLGFKTGLVSGTLTLTLMILPTVINASIEALKSVPMELREGSLALGATKLQTIVRVVLPAALPGILTGVILGIGRAIGETAALLFTMGSNLALIRSFNSPIRVLSVHLYMLIRENISISNAFATATILVIIVFLVNLATRRLIGRMTKRSGL